MQSSGGPLGDLRRSRRLDIGKLVAGEIVPSGVPIKIRDIGFGGFAMETTFPVEVASVHDFRFTSKDGSAFSLRATVIHTRQVSSPESAVVHVSGLEFAERQAPSEQRADVLMDKVNWILSFYDEVSRDASERDTPEDPPSTTRPRPRLRAPES
jgi:hypothetical protein